MHTFVGPNYRVTTYAPFPAWSSGLWVPGKERCAVIIGSVFLKHYRVRRFVEVENRAEDPFNFFAIYNEQVADIELAPGERLLGAIHSHPWPHRIYPERLSMFDWAGLQRINSLGGVIDRHGHVEYFRR